MLEFDMSNLYTEPGVYQGLDREPLVYKDDVLLLEEGIPLISQIFNKNINIG